MEIIIAIASLFVANSLHSPPWWEVVLQALFVVFAVIIGSVRISNDLDAMRRHTVKARRKKLKQFTDEHL